MRNLSNEIFFGGGRGEERKERKRKERNEKEDGITGFTGFTGYSKALVFLIAFPCLLPGLRR
jgi:hypothetical protein